MFVRTKAAQGQLIMFLLDTIPGNPSNKLGQLCLTHDIPKKKYVEPTIYPKRSMFNPRYTRRGVCLTDDIPKEEYV